MDVLLASTNEHKAKELRRILAGSPIRLLLPAEYGLTPLGVAETGRTFEENATAKAYAYLQAYRMATLADDSGLSVDALAGAPGVRSARFGGEGLNDAGRTRYLLRSLEGIPQKHRCAHYTCCLALAQPDVPTTCAHGYCYGYITTEPVDGPTGFGYDPVFFLPQYGRTVSQITPEQKDLVGHRGRASRALLKALGMASAA